MLQQGEGAERDHVRGGLVPGDQQQHSHAGQLPPGQLAGRDPLGRQPGEQVVGRVGELSLDQLVQVVQQSSLGCLRDLRGVLRLIRVLLLRWKKSWSA